MVAHSTDERNNELQKKRVIRVIELVKAGSLVSAAIRKVGFKRGVFYDRLHKCPELIDSLKRAKVSGPGNIALDALYKRGVKGYLKPVFQQGRQVGTIREFSDTAAIFWCKSNIPECRDVQPNFSNTVQVNHVDVRLVLDAQTDLERQAIEQFTASRQPAFNPSTIDQSDGGFVK